MYYHAWVCLHVCVQELNCPIYGAIVVVLTFVCACDSVDAIHVKVLVTTSQQNSLMCAQ